MYHVNPTRAAIRPCACWLSAKSAPLGQRERTTCIMHKRIKVNSIRLHIKRKCFSIICDDILQCHMTLEFAIYLFPLSANQTIIHMIYFVALPFINARHVSCILASEEAYMNVVLSLLKQTHLYLQEIRPGFSLAFPWKNIHFCTNNRMNK